MSGLRLVKPVPEVVDVAEGLCDLNDEIERLRYMRSFPRAYLWETIGKAMLAAGERKKTIDGYTYHVAPPREKQYCGCHRALLYTCPTPIGKRPPDLILPDKFPDFYVTRAKDDHES